VTYYEILLYLHIVFSIVWLGSGLLIQILGFRAVSANNLERIKGLLDDSDWLTTRLFIPTSLAVFVLGVLLTIEGPWEFGELWIVIGLGGYATTFLTGLLLISRQVKKVAAVMERDGGMSPAAVAETKRLFLITRVDLVVLYTVVLDMVLKPRAEDVGTLVLMATAVLAATAYSLARFRAPTPTAA
jgi:uncharacterized membrane protein